MHPQVEVRDVRRRGRVSRAVASRSTRSRCPTPRRDRKRCGRSRRPTAGSARPSTLRLNAAVTPGRIVVGRNQHLFRLHQVGTEQKMITRSQSRSHRTAGTRNVRRVRSCRSCRRGTPPFAAPPAGSRSSWAVKSARNAATRSSGYDATKPAQAARSASSLTSRATYPGSAVPASSIASSSILVFSDDPDPSSIRAARPGDLDHLGGVRHQDRGFACGSGSTPATE